MSKKIDLTGQKFGKLTVIEYVGSKNNRAIWRCKCSCPEGNEVIVPTTHLKSGHTQSCGCFLKEKLADRADDLTGQKFGRWTVLEKAGKDKQGSILWKCQCSCEKGTIKNIPARSLKTGDSTSCGCYARELTSERSKANHKPKPIINMVGERYGKLTVQRMVERNIKEKVYWVCSCDCGGERITNRDMLIRGKATDCGCMKPYSYRKDFPRLYRIWSGMKQRCLNPKSDSYKDYGGRGITVCEEWQKDFEPFARWALVNGYDDGLTIDRRNVNGNYEPSNCRWITAFEQAGNTRKNINITYNGQTKTLSEWCRELNLNFGTVKYRLKVGYSVEQAFFGLPNDQYKKVKRK